MHIIDILAFIAYPALVINLILLVWYFSTSFLFQIRNRVILVLMVLIYLVALFWGGQQFYNLYRRYEVVFGDAQPTSTSTQFILLQVGIAISLTGINYLLYARKTDMTINLPRFRRRKKGGDE